MRAQAAVIEAAAMAASACCRAMALCMPSPMVFAATSPSMASAPEGAPPTASAFSAVTASVIWLLTVPLAPLPAG